MDPRHGDTLNDRTCSWRGAGADADGRTMASQSTGMAQSYPTKAALRLGDKELDF